MPASNNTLSQKQLLPVFDIKRYSINDGPGIRITIFFKGCPLHCPWCHNPEGISPRQTKMYTLSKCIACRSCIKACKHHALKEEKGRGIVTDTSKCVSCGECASVCPTNAMEMALKYYSLPQLMEEIEKERPFFESSGGGVTLCGGEPLLQGEKLFPLLEECGKRGIHRAVDTTLFADPQLVMEVARRCDLFLVDLKMMDSAKHREYCGVPNDRILANIRLLAENHIPFIIRIPLIEGINADEKNMRDSADFLKSTGARPLVELLPYHDIAKGKHSRLGTMYNPQNLSMREPTAEEMQWCKSCFDWK